MMKLSHHTAYILHNNLYEAANVQYTSNTVDDAGMIARFTGSTANHTTNLYTLYGYHNHYWYMYLTCLAVTTLPPTTSMRG
jgi:hypothetical protein